MPWKYYIDAGLTASTQVGIVHQHSPFHLAVQAIEPHGLSFSDAVLSLCRESSVESTSAFEFGVWVGDCETRWCVGLEEAVPPHPPSVVAGVRVWCVVLCFVIHLENLISMVIFEDWRVIFLSQFVICQRTFQVTWSNQGGILFLFLVLSLPLLVLSPQHTIHNTQQNYKAIVTCHRQECICTSNMTHIVTSSGDQTSDRLLSFENVLETTSNEEEVRHLYT